MGTSVSEIPSTKRPLLPRKHLPLDIEPALLELDTQCPLIQLKP